MLLELNIYGIVASCMPFTPYDFYIWHHFLIGHFSFYPVIIPEFLKNGWVVFVAWGELHLSIWAEIFCIKQGKEKAMKTSICSDTHKVWGPVLDGFVALIICYWHWVQCWEHESSPWIPPGLNETTCCITNGPGLRKFVSLQLFLQPACSFRNPILKYPTAS